MEEQNSRFLYVANMTSFFSREMFMYALGDIKFKKPVSLRKMAYIMFFIVVWSGPIFYFGGLQINAVYFAFMFGPPFVLGHYATKPIWGGRGLYDFAKVTFNFVKEPKAWADLYEYRTKPNDKMFVEQEIWISRRREISLLEEMKKNKENFNKYNNKQKVKN